MNIYEYSSIPDIITNFKNEQRLKGNPVTLEKIAHQIRIQKSYLSKVMKSEAILNKDQAYELASFMQLDETQRDYIFLLIDHFKAGNKNFRDELKGKIKTIQTQNTQTKNYISKHSFDESNSDFQKYYLKPEMQLVHLGFALNKYQKEPELLKFELGINQADFQDILLTLESLELIEVKKDRIKLIKSNLHLSNESPLFNQWSILFKLKSIEWLKRLESDEKYNFNVTFSASDKDREQIRIEFMSFIKKVENIVKNSTSKNLYQLNFDLFKWL